jgi:hypothetical protein
LRAFLLGWRRGCDPRKFLSSATKETSDRFWRKTGADRAGRLAVTLDEWFARQTFIHDPHALQALSGAIRKRFPDLP